MGFYGNITNTAKTSFSFDKIYSNRYDMDTSRGSDGVYVGRYVLVEYDTKQSEDAYPEYFYYNGNMYGAVNMVKVVNDSNKQFILSPQEATKITSIPAGTIVRVPVEKQVTNVNETSFFVQIKEVDENKITYSGNDVNFLEFLKNNYKIIPLTEEQYEPGKYYKYFRDMDDPTSDTYNEFIYKFDEKFYKSNISTGAQYLARTGASVKPERGLWVWVDVDKYGEEVNEYASLALNGYHDPSTTWRKWWTDHFAKTTFPYGQFEEYYEMAAFDGTVQYAIPLIDNFFPINLTEVEWEPKTYYVKNSKGELELDDAKEYMPMVTYYDRGIDDRSIFITDDNLYYTSGVTFNVGECYRVRASHKYSTNSDYQRFYLKNADDTWRELTFSSDSVYFASTGNPTYLTNFTIDVAAYGTSRGYDSTVWQKVYTQGTEAYVMIAELNSVVPTFDISADAPTLVPITPHFDEDTTNVYYKLHWQPTWGFRTKAANSGLLGPRIQQDGSIGSFAMELLTSDNTYYPSDVTTKWQGNFYNNSTDLLHSSYYSQLTGNWTGAEDDEDTQIPAAIYFNKDGFDVENIAYSDDLLDATNEERYNISVAESGWTNNDSIKVQPTGKSGHLYNSHSNTIDQQAKEDTQELSIMLPSIGDTIANIWDIVFGGRDTNKNIAETNTRNTDIEWESSRAVLNRHGLRLVHTDHRGNNSFAKAEVNTIAGAINSAHDIMGMIITDASKATLEARLDNLDENRIYYDTTNKKYYRKHLTYEYTPKTEDSDTYTYIEITDQINQDTFNYNNLFIEEDGEYIRVKVGDEYDPEAHYYKRYGSIIEERQLTEFTDNYYYMDFTGSDFDLNPSANMDMMDYISDAKYHQGANYYTIDPSAIKAYALSAGYKPGRFFYKVGDDYQVDFSKSAIEGRQYYNINRNKVVDIAEFGYNGIYVPGVYYYYDTAEQSWKLDQSYTANPNRVYYRPYATEITDDEDGEEQKIYRKEIEYQEVVPIDQATFEKDLQLGKLYYKFENEALGVSLYTLYTGTWESYLTDKVTLYAASIKYVLTTETSYEIDESNPYILVNYSPGSYFFENIGEDGRLLGYHPISDIQEIDPDDPTLHYKAFICGWDKTNNRFYDWCTNTLSPFTVPQAYQLDIENPDTQIYSLYACHKMNLDTFYLPNKYHYKDANGSYILDTYPTMTHSIYYTIEPNGIHKIDPSIEFYEPYRYYRWNAQASDYELVRDNLTQKQIDAEPLYWKNELYVYNDRLGVYSKGAVWNPNVLDEPDSIILATRKERYELKEIPDFARNLNTMHGLLLKLNQYMEYDDTYTRDERIANGLMNQLKDILQSFDQILPRHLMTVDNYGRITSTDWQTNQKESSQQSKAMPLVKDTTGDVFEQVETVEEMKKQWITLDLDGNVYKPTLTVHHNFQPVADSETAIDLNTVEDKNSPEANQIDANIPKVDDMGHVVGQNNRMITLPFGFKTIHTFNSLEATNVESVSDNVDAQNTQDTLDIGGGNKWINVTAIKEDKQIQISHNVATIPQTDDQLDLNDDLPGQIVAQSVKYDEAGHIIEDKKNTYILPYNIKSINVKNTGGTLANIGTTADDVIIADNAKDEFILEMGNKWLGAIADPTQKAITLFHKAAGATSEDKTKGVNNDRLTPKFGETFVIPTVGIDETGHVSLLEENEITIPLPSLVNGEGNVVTKLSLDAKTGAFTETRANVGTLKLTDYEIGENKKVITANDTINSAFGKLQLQIQSLTSQDIKVEDEYVEKVGETMSDAIAHFIKFGGITLDSNDKNGTVEEITVQPNYTVVLKNKVEALDLSFVEVTDYYAKYSVVFTTSRVGCNLSIPESFTWDGDEPPVLDGNKKYILVTDNVTNIVTISKGVVVE